MTTSCGCRCRRRRRSGRGDRGRRRWWGRTGDRSRDRIGFGFEWRKVRGSCRAGGGLEARQERGQRRPRQVAVLAQRLPASWIASAVCEQQSELIRVERPDFLPRSPRISSRW